MCKILVPAAPDRANFLPRINQTSIDVMDPLFMAHYYFRRRKLEECIAICTELLLNNPYDQVSFSGAVS